ncbi:MAG: hypothetical protein Aurels2KO_57980 [Aureliella sp.]
MNVDRRKSHYWHYVKTFLIALIFSLYFLWSAVQLWFVATEGTVQLWLTSETYSLEFKRSLFFATTFFHVIFFIFYTAIIYFKVRLYLWKRSGSRKAP